MNKELEMYLDFRRHIDTLAFENMKSEIGNGWNRIWDGEELAGFLAVGEDTGHVHGIYVKPECRRKGLATRAVAMRMLDYKRCGGKIKRLAILNNNEPAKAFWDSLFILYEIDNNAVETLYAVGAPKQRILDEIRKKLDSNEFILFLREYLYE